jgi:hypothetical protein
MSDEYENEVEVVERRYSAFWPFLILLAGLFLWSGFQAFSTYRQCSTTSAQLTAAAPTAKQADDVRNKLYALAQDLLQTAAKDPYAAQIVKEANIQVRQPATNAPDAGASAPAVPPSTDGTH